MTMKGYIKNKTLIKVVSNAFWLTADKVYTLALGMFVTALVARYFGPEQYGVLNYALSFVAILSIGATLGFETLGVKEIVEKKKDEGVVLGTTFVLRGIGALGIVVIAYTLIRVVEPENQVLHSIVTVMAVVLVVRSVEVIEYWVQGHQKVKFSSLIRMVAFTVVSAYKIILVRNQGTLRHLSYAYLLDATLVALGLMAVYRYTNGNRRPWHFDRRYGKELLSQSWYIMFSAIMMTVFTRIDQLMLGSMMPSQSDLGIYSAAAKIATMWYFVPGAITKAFQPIILSEAATAEKALKHAQVMYNVIAWVGIGFGIVISLTSGIIVNLLYGEAYSEASRILTISIWAGTFATLGGARAVWLIKEGKQKYSLYSTGVGAVVNIALNLFLIPLYGGYGAAIATLITQGIVNVGVFYIIKDTRASTKMMLGAFNPKQVMGSIKEFRR